MERLNAYLDYLKEEGYRPAVDDDGDIVFKAEGKMYVLFNPADDTELLRLGALGLWPLESPDELALAFRVCSSVTGRFKLAKVYVVGDSNVMATIDQLLPEADLIEAIFPRALSIIQEAVREFREEMIASKEELPVARA